MLNFHKACPCKQLNGNNLAIQAYRRSTKDNIIDVWLLLVMTPKYYQTSVSVTLQGVKLYENERKINKIKEDKQNKSHHKWVPNSTSFIIKI